MLLWNLTTSYISRICCIIQTNVVVFLVFNKMAKYVANKTYCLILTTQIENRVPKLISNSPTVNCYETQKVKYQVKIKATRKIPKLSADYVRLLACSPFLTFSDERTAGTRQSCADHCRTTVTWTRKHSGKLLNLRVHIYLTAHTNTISTS